MPGRRAPRRSSRLARAAALACALSAANAGAAPEPVRFAWVRGAGAEACSTQAAVVAQITARLGRSPFAEGAALSIDAYVGHAEAGWRAEIYVRDREGKLAGARELTSEALDCGAIESATVLALALAIDPEGALRGPEPTPPAPVSLPPSPAPLPLAAPREPPPPTPIVARESAGAVAPPTSSLGGSGVALRGVAGLGLLPRAAAGASLAAHVELTPAWALTAEALWLPEASVADDRFAFGLSAFALGACATAARTRAADLAACGAIWGGALHAVVRGLVPSGPGDRAWAAASATPRLRLRLASRVHLELGGQLLVPLVRRPFTVTGWAEPVFQQTPVAFLPFAGLGANFP